MAVFSVNYANSLIGDLDNSCKKRFDGWTVKSWGPSIFVDREGPFVYKPIQNETLSVTFG